MRRIALAFIAVTILWLPWLQAAGAASTIPVLQVMKPTLDLNGWGSRVIDDPDHNVMYAIGPRHPAKNGKPATESVVMVNALTGQILESLTLKLYTEMLIGYDSQTQHIVMATERGNPFTSASARLQLLILTRQPLRVVKKIALGTGGGLAMSIADLAVSTQARYAFVLVGSGSVIRVSLDDGAVRRLSRPLPNDPAVFGSLGIDEGAQRLVSTTNSAITFFDLKTGTQVRSILGEGGTATTIDEDRHLLIVPGEGVGLDVFDIRTGKIAGEVDTLRFGFLIDSRVGIIPQAGKVYGFGENLRPKKSGSSSGEDVFMVIDYLHGGLVTKPAAFGDEQNIVVDQVSGHMYALFSPSNKLVMIDTATSNLGGTLTLHKKTKANDAIGLGINERTHRVFVVGWGKQWVIDSDRP